MRIVHIEAGRHLYGGAAQVRDLVAALTRAGHGAILVCARGSALRRAARSIPTSAANPIASTATMYASGHIYFAGMTRIE